MLQNLLPISDKHSIKEAVFSVFLASKIMKPKEFKQLLITDFVSDFQQFEPLTQMQFKFEQQNLSVNQVDDAGFKFVKYQDGNIAEVLQGMNNENQYFFSSHIFKYNTWQEFKDKFIKYLKTLSTFQPGSYVQAYSLLYMDEFNWDNKNEYNSSIVFNKDSEFLPKDFFNSSNIVYNINLEKNNDGKSYSDLLSINISDKLIYKNIIVVHNQTFALSDTIKLDDLLVSHELETNLESAHKQNKKLLKNILTIDVCNLINI
ncbi:MAG: TIGR04255 family protein [Paludibacter sp.]|nr:TIGR04255 family protein [Paludibacter sp.]